MYGKSKRGKSMKTYANPHYKHSKSSDVKGLEREIAKGLPKRTALSNSATGERGSK